ILRLPPNAKALEVWFSDPGLQPKGGNGLDGLAFGEDGHLYEDRYDPGDLYRIGVKGGKAGGTTEHTTLRSKPSRSYIHLPGYAPAALRRSETEVVGHRDDHRQEDDGVIEQVQLDAGHEDLYQRHGLGPATEVIPRHGLGEEQGMLDQVPALDDQCRRPQSQ